jgi:hypothetical protein
MRNSGLKQRAEESMKRVAEIKRQWIYLSVNGDHQLEEIAILETCSFKCFSSVFKNSG